jgi:glycerol kinase
LILGIDQGSTGSKAIVVDHNGDLAASAYHQIETRYPRDGWVEHDAADIWLSVESCLRDLAARLDFGRISAIGITNQRETCIVWDRKTGMPLTPALSWQCTRSLSIVESWEPLRDEVLEKTGLGLSAY